MKPPYSKWTDAKNFPNNFKQDEPFQYINLCWRGHDLVVPSLLGDCS